MAPGACPPAPSVTPCSAVHTHKLAVRISRPLQVAQYESNVASGALHPGCPVTLSWDYKRHGDAREGPLHPGKVGVVVEDGLSKTGAYVVKVGAEHARAGVLLVGFWAPLNCCTGCFNAKETGRQVMRACGKASM